MIFQRLARAAFTFGTATIVALSVLPAHELPSVQLWDKLQHALAYGLVAAAGALGYAGRARAWVTIGIGLAALGGALEIVQAFVPGRESDVADAAANAIGTLAGIAAVAAIGRLAGRVGRLGHVGR